MSDERSPFHPGEQALQARVGRREAVERAGRRMIRDYMPDQHRAFFASLPFVLVGSLDEAGRPWASLLEGAPGFLSSPDPRTLRVSATPSPHDPLAKNLAAGATLGMLGIEFHTRRRNRMNGTVAQRDSRGFEVRVDQSFGNCPKYIRERSPAGEGNGSPGACHREGGGLSPRALAIVERADTFFIASAAPGAGADVSHRGGQPGFVRVRARGGRTVLTAPDFVGNSLFNTFGNLALEPRCGLLFVDFASGDLLQLGGRAEVLWDSPELADFAGAQRLLRVEVEGGVLRERALALAWSPSRPGQPPVAAGRHFPLSFDPDNAR